MTVNFQNSICPGCGLIVQSADQTPDDRYNASFACRQLYDQLSAFTQSLGDTAFIHQLVVDSYTAQHFGPKIKPIGISFALIGLDLVFEHGYSGKAVQLAHMQIARTRHQWPVFVPPAQKGTLTVMDVVPDLNTENYQDRIYRWGKSVWQQWNLEHEYIEGLIKLYL